MNRKKTRQIKAGNLLIGGDAPISIQSMTNLPIEDTEGTIGQIKALENAGADIVRLAILNEEAVHSFKKIAEAVSIPLVADIHFDYRLAIAAIGAGASKIRINPGNIGDAWKVKEVIRAASEKNIPIRIGVNGGSINRKKYSHVTPDALVESAMGNIHILEENNFTDMAVSIKSSDIFHTIEANRILSDMRNYPIHLGLTEAGFGISSLVQSSIVIGHLLLQGIGDTIRVSITGDPLQEIDAGKKILESLSLKYSPLKIISCPTCGRTSPDIDLLNIAQNAESEILLNFENTLKERNLHITVAVMGCEVNGPGEAKEADFGIAGGRSGFMHIFAKGKVIKKVQVSDAVKELLDVISHSLKQKNYL
jgi:(E)-4-hydroxy-3-methylbut-2-enyl-diphosphate synthase